MDFIREGGAPMLLVLLFGIVALVGASRYLRGGERAHWLLALGATVTTGVVGLLGTVTGLQRSVLYLSQVPADERWIFLHGAARVAEQPRRGAGAGGGRLDRADAGIDARGAGRRLSRAAVAADQRDSSHSPGSSRPSKRRCWKRCMPTSQRSTSPALRST